MKSRHGVASWICRSLQAAIAGGTVVVLVGCGGGSSLDGGSANSSGQAGTRAVAPGSATPGRSTVQSASSGTATPQLTLATDLEVTGITKVAEVRVGRTSFDYTFKITVRNKGSSAYGSVVLTLTSAGAGATVVDGTVAMGSIAAGAETSPADTITIRQDRLQTFNAAALVWSIEGSTGLAPKEQLAALENSGAIPKLERGNTLQGIDANGNGVRDDVEAYINANYTMPLQRAAALQAAKAFQATLLVDPSNVQAAKVTASRVIDGLNWIFSRFDGAPATKDPSQVSKELEAITTNTKQRLLAYLAYNKALDGTSSALPEGDTCE